MLTDRPRWHRHLRRCAAAVLLCASVTTAALGLRPAAAADGVANSESNPWGPPYHGDFADPAVVKVGGTYYGYSTTLNHHAVPMFTSPDLSTWTAMVDATTYYEPVQLDALPMTNAAPWVYVYGYSADAWAPSVAQLPNGAFALAYSASGWNWRRCIGLATSTGPITPYRDTSPTPLVCPRKGKAIDPYLYVSRGRVWLLYKTQVGGKSRIWSRELDPNLRPGEVARWRPHSRPRLLLRPSQRWEGHVVENPALFTYAGRTYLFYSANDFRTGRYATGYARCVGPLGPCRRPQHTPILASAPGRLGPGGPAPVVAPGGELALGYAAYASSPADYGSSRTLHFARLSVLRNGTLRVADPTWH